MGSGRIVVVGYATELRREEGAAQLLRALGARVCTLEPFADADDLSAADPAARCIRAVVVEVPERPDLAVSALRHIRHQGAFAHCGALAAVSPGQVAQLDPAGGFDDFVLVPYVPAELYARLRAVEWRRCEFANEERIKLGRLVIDRAGHEVSVDGATRTLTAREFALLVYLCERRGRVIGRPEALARVWPESYDGGERTVDIHIRRLRHKLGDAFPVQTVRGVGYRLALPLGAEVASTASASSATASAVTADRPTPEPRSPEQASPIPGRPERRPTLDAWVRE